MLSRAKCLQTGFALEIRFMDTYNSELLVQVTIKGKNGKAIPVTGREGP
jgi:hypothetical protein